MEVLVSELIEQLTPPTVTVPLDRFEPVIVSKVPPPSDPEEGVTVEMDGGAT
jgi:hypothetical protein